MNKLTVESLFGFNAGVVWEALNQNGATNLANLAKTTSLSREDVYGALGWLGREDKIVVEQKGRAMVFSLRDEEARLAIPKETILAESTPKPKSKSSTSKPPKKAKKARKAKSPVKRAKSPAEQSKNVEEFTIRPNVPYIQVPLHTNSGIGGMHGTNGRNRSGLQGSLGEKRSA